MGSGALPGCVCVCVCVCAHTIGSLSCHHGHKAEEEALTKSKCIPELNKVPTCQKRTLGTHNFLPRGRLLLVPSSSGGWLTHAPHQPGGSLTTLKSSALQTSPRKWQESSMSRMSCPARS